MADNTTKNLSVKELDFDGIKQQFVEFLKTQTAFKDYNFSGTNMSVLMDILAYNTYQNGFQRNMAINEMFLDSARLPTSVASHAKFLNYVPRSRVSSRAILDVELSTETSAPFLILPAYTQFTSSGSGISYRFYTLENALFERKNGQYRSNIEVFEGRIMEETFYVRTETPKIDLSRPDIDISSIRLTVEDKNGVLTSWVYAPNLFDIDSRSEVFYVQTSNMETYQIYFGENNFGASPEIGSKIRVTYIYTAGEEANGVSRFSPPTTTGDISRIRIMNVVTNSQYGAERETIDSVKLNAPLISQTQRRAVVESDYQALIKERFPQIQSISAVGGEKLNPPEYGRVAVIVDMKDIDGVPEYMANDIVSFLKQRSPITVEPIVKPATFSYISVSSIVRYNVSTSTMSSSDIKKLVMSSIMKYSSENLDGFNRTARLSKLQSYIDSSDSVVISNNTKIRPILEIYPEVGRLGSFKLDFGTRLIPQAEQTLRSITSVITNHPSIPPLKGTRSEQTPAIISGSFTFDGNICYLTDDGYGSINVVREYGDSNIIVQKNIGSVDYNTGIVNINNFSVQDILDTRIKIYANTRDGDLKAPPGNIIKIREEDVVIEVVADA